MTDYRRIVRCCALRPCLKQNAGAIFSIEYGIALPLSESFDLVIVGDEPREDGKTPAEFLGFEAESLSDDDAEALARSRGFTFPFEDPHTKAYAAAAHKAESAYVAKVKADRDRPKVDHKAARLKSNREVAAKTRARLLAQWSQGK